MIRRSFKVISAIHFHFSVLRSTSSREPSTKSIINDENRHVCKSPNELRTCTVPSSIAAAAETGSWNGKVLEGVNILFSVLNIFLFRLEDSERQKLAQCMMVIFCSNLLRAPGPGSRLCTYQLKNFFLLLPGWGLMVLFSLSPCVAWLLRN